jgi:acid phosphatase (class A)
MRRTGLILTGLLAALPSSVQAQSQMPAGSAAMGPSPTAMTASTSPQTRLGRGYLDVAALPDSIALLPTPPQPGSRVQAQDDRAARAALRLHGSARWDQAIIDADLFSPQSTSTFSCAAGIAISPETTHALNQLMRKVGPDFAMAVYAAKRKYERPRPFLTNNAPVCTPEMRDVLTKDFSYPSGHAAIGVGWSLLLGELIPARTSALRARGAAFAESRRICNVHWRSDVLAGGKVAEAVWVALQPVAAFQADLAAARAELKAVQAKPDAAACQQERRALRMR